MIFFLNVKNNLELIKPLRLFGNSKGTVKGSGVLSKTPFKVSYDHTWKQGRRQTVANRRQSAVEALLQSWGASLRGKEVAKEDSDEEQEDDSKEIVLNTWTILKMGSQKLS